MDQTFVYTLTAGIIAALITSLGIFVINKYAKWGKKNVVYFMAFAAGVLISVSFLHLIPESIEMNSNAPLFLFIGFIVMYLLNRFLHVMVCRDKECKTFGIIPAIGIGFHSFVDGIIFAVTFSVSVFTGILSVIGMILHEFPEGIVTYLFLFKSGFNKRKSSLYAFLAAAITTPLGVLVSYPYISTLSDSKLGILLSLSAGALTYVGATHLLPEVEHNDKKYTLIALAVGILVAYIIISGHGHA